MDIPADSSLPTIRSAIDEIDNGIVDLLGQRARLIDRVAQLKRARGQPVRDPVRESAIMDRLRAAAQAAGVDPEVITGIYRLIFDEAVRRQTSHAADDQCP